VYNVSLPLAPVTGVVINEIMADNTITHVDEAGQFEDWVELYNNDPTSVDLSLWFVSDSPFEPYKWRFPVGTTIPGNGYLIVWCDKDEAQGDTHTNFKLSDAGESFLLLTDDSLLVDETVFGPQQADMGYARVPNGTGPFVIQQPTYAANNNAVGIEEPAYASRLLAFPNPAATQLVILLEGSAAQQATITDAVGRTQWSGRIAARTQLDVSAWATGSYVLRTSGTAIKFMVVR
jgi:hypothetical protein